MGISDGMFTGDVWRAIEELRQQLRNLTSGRRLEDASIGARGIRLLEGGNFTIFGGALRLTDETGSVGLVYFGDNQDGTGRIWQFSFPSGEVAFGLLNSSGDGFWGGNDHQGNIIISNDAGSGAGLARPYLNYRLVPTFSAQSVGEGSGSMWPSTTSASLIGLLEGRNAIWHPRVAYTIVTTTTGGGDVEWELRFGDAVAASGTGGAAATVETPDWGDDLLPGHESNITVHARITGTATRGWIQVTRLYGTQS